ncbi:hypothetical protein FNF28_02779 [Cafeteria roenbergensis]|uniref:Anaphase-promoting complex subunit 4-like WD40 domain-containing protein n=1 Tax=Cafeteria roenbergensis TaxID=33653 RepID=A0A5A8DQ39_CAFRO|nr:hypothetical protein FNF28_02779 [Cafeteria roenbergensis]
MAEVLPSPLELEHVIGYTGHHHAVALCNPLDDTGYITCLGCFVVFEDATDPHKQEFLEAHDGEVSSLAVCGVGGLLASGQAGSARVASGDAPVVVWDLKSRERVYDLFALRGGVEHLAFAPDGRFLAAAGSDGQLAVWDMQTGEQVAGVASERRVETLCWGAVDTAGRRPSYPLFVARAGAVRRMLLAHDMRKMGYGVTATDMPTPSGGFARTYSASAVDASGQSLLLGSTAGDLVVFSTVTGLFRAAFAVCSGGVHALCTVPAGPDAPEGGVFVGGGDGTVLRFAGADLDWVCEAEADGGVGGPVVALDLSAAGGWLLAGTSAGRLARVGVHPGETVLPVSVVEEAQTGPVTSVSFGAATSNRVASGSADGTICVWSLDDYSVVARCSPQRVAAAGSAAGIPGSSGTGAPVPAATCVALQEDSRTVLSGWSDGHIRCFSAETGAEQWRSVAHRGAVTALQSLSSFFVTGGADGRVCVWARDTNELLTQFGEHTREVLVVATDVDRAELLYTLGADRSLLRFDLRSERLVMAHRLPRATAARLSAMTQRRHGEKELITGGADGRVLCWDDAVADKPVQGTTTAEPIAGAVSRGQPVPVRAAAVSPTGRFVALALEDGAVRVLDAASLSVVAESRGHSQPVLCLAWSPDERQVVSGGQDCCMAVHNFFLAPEAGDSGDPGGLGEAAGSDGGPSLAGREGRGSAAGAGRGNVDDFDAGRGGGQAAAARAGGASERPPLDPHGRGAGSGRGSNRAAVPMLDTRKAAAGATAAAGGAQPSDGWGSGSVASAGGRSSGRGVQLPSLAGAGASGRRGSGRGSHRPGSAASGHTALW